MTTLADAKWAALSAYPGAMPEKTLAWLQANGATSNAIPDAWAEMLATQGFDSYQRSDDWYALLDSLA
ncbi:MAG: hypothetical protein DRH08_06680, partial [Deltaproteobacteria bacterium]